MVYIIVGGGIYFKAKVGALPILLFNLSNLAGILTIYFGTNTLLIISLIILNVASNFFMIESVKREQAGYSLRFSPPFFKYFDVINTLLSVAASWSLYILCGVSIYYKFFNS